MNEGDRYLVFLCSGTIKTGSKKLSHRIASALVAMGCGAMGSLSDLSQQQRMPADQQRRMLFINDCRSGCVRMLTHGLNEQNYIYLDISAHAGSQTFDVDHFIATEVILRVKDKWYHTLSESSHSA